MNKNIILTGFIGTGKSTIGQLVADCLQRDFVDMDAIIETREGRPISQMFAEEGEPYFRRIEAGLCRELAGQSALVIATGGALVSAENRRVMEESGLVVCLDCEPEVRWQRIGQSEDRPMLAERDEGRIVRLAALLEKRTPAFARVEHQLDVTHLSPDEAAERICELANSVGQTY